MSSKSGYPGSNQCDAVGMGRVVIAGRFTTQAATGTTTIVAGSGFTVIKQATGRYAVTLDNAVTEIVAVTATVSVETLGTTEATTLVGEVDQDSIDTDSFELRIKTAAGALADDAGSEVNFIAVCRFSSVDL